jgi:hypothetical protein
LRLLVVGATARDPIVAVQNRFRLYVVEVLDAAILCSSDWNKVFEMNDPGRRTLRLLEQCFNACSKCVVRIIAPLSYDRFACFQIRINLGARADPEGLELTVKLSSRPASSDEAETLALMAFFKAMINNRVLIPLRQDDRGPASFHRQCAGDLRSLIAFESVGF